MIYIPFWSIIIYYQEREDRMKRVVALVTGSNRGIGAACVEEFAKQGVTVVINYCHHEAEAKKLEKEM